MSDRVVFSPSSWFFVKLALFCSVSFRYWIPALQRYLIRTEQRGRSTSLVLMAMIYLVQPGMFLGFFTVRVHCWLKASSILSPRSCLTKLPSGQSAPSRYWSMGLLIPRCRAVFFSLLELKGSLFAAFSSPLCYLRETISAMNTPLNFVSSVNSLSVDYFHCPSH